MSGLLRDRPKDSLKLRAHPLAGVAIKGAAAKQGVRLHNLSSMATPPLTGEVDSLRSKSPKLGAKTSFESTLHGKKIENGA